MNPLSIPILEAMLLLAKLTVIFLWGVVLVSVAIRIILGSIMDELLDPREED